MNADPRETLSRAPMSTLQFIAIAVTVGLNALDGFDVLSISFASPGIAIEWGIDRAALGIVLGRRATPILFAMLPLYLLMVALWWHVIGSYDIYGPWEWFLLAGVVVCLVAAVLNISSSGSSTRPAAGATAAIPLGSYPVGAVPPPALGGPQALGGPPALTLTVVITLLFGVFGLIPAALHANAAQRMGYPAGRYWKAFGWCFAASVVISIILTVVVYLAVYAALMSSSTTY